MKIVSIEARPVRLARDLHHATGTAGSPTVLSTGRGDYRWSSVYPALYSVNFETALVRIKTDSGIEGWGEAQAPLAPEVACAIIDKLLAPMLMEESWEATPTEIERLWELMYSTMRVRGQTGGFMIDAITALDIALWDVVGKAVGVSVSRLISDSARAKVPAYLSGLAQGGDPGTFQLVKRFFDTPTADEFLRDLSPGCAVDALWRLTPEAAVDFGRELDSRQALWFEAPLLPEDPHAHASLARQLKTPIALGESYRTRFEMEPFFRAGALRVFQPDLGRSGITEGLRLARRANELGIQVVPHISIAFGPQIAAALHFAAVAPGCDLAEYNPQVLKVANQYLKKPIELDGTSWVVPDGPGLGIDLEWP